MAKSKAVDKLLGLTIETYFQLRNEPLSHPKRFLYALLGSLSLFFSADLVREIQFESPILAFVPLYMKSFLFPILAASFFGFLIAQAKTKHGPVRLYLSGVLLPAFVVSIVRATWSINILNEVGGAG